MLSTFSKFFKSHLKAAILRCLLFVMPMTTPGENVSQLTSSDTTLIQVLDITFHKLEIVPVNLAPIEPAESAVISCQLDNILSATRKSKSCTFSGHNLWTRQVSRDFWIQKMFS